MGFLHPEQCLCGVHVHTATKVVGIIFLILAVIEFLNDNVNYTSSNVSVGRAILTNLINVAGMVVIALLL